MTRQRWATRSAEAGTALLERPGMLLGLGDSLQTRALQQLTVRAKDDEEGTFEGYGCVWDVVDTYGTTFRRGCFTEGGLDAGDYALLEMHDPTKVIGAFTAKEDDHGLFIAGAWDDTTAGRDARVKGRRSAPGLSVGFVPIGVDPEDDSAFTSARLVETSQITLRMASVPGASITSARQIQLEAEQRKADADVALAMLALARPVRLR